MAITLKTGLIFCGFISVLIGLILIITAISYSWGTWMIGLGTLLISMPINVFKK